MPNLKLIQLLRMGQAFMNHELAAQGLSSGLFYFVLELSRHDSLSMTELSEAVAVDRAHCTRAIDKLIRYRLVQRETDSSDHRSARVSLTSQGKRAAKHVTAAVENWVKIITTDVSPSDLAITTQVIDQFHKNARANRQIW